MAQSAKQYFEQLFQEAGFSQEDTSTLIGKLSHDKVAGKLDSLVRTATEDYNAQLGRVRKAEENLQQWKEWAEGNPQAGKAGAVAQYNQMLEAYNAAQARLQAIEAAAGVTQTQATQTTTNGTQQYLTLADLSKFTQDLDSRWSGALKQSNLITSRHVRNFNEDPDFDAIQKIAAEKGLASLPDGLTQAYEHWIAPREKQREEEARKKWEADKTAEIERDLRTRMQLPAVEPTQTDYAPLFNSKQGALSDADLDAALVAEFNSAAKR